MQLHVGCLIKMRKINKKAQLKIQEMAFMMLAVVLLFILAGLFFVSIKYKEMYKTSTSLEKEKTISTIAKLAETPEFTCGTPLCIDTDKLFVMQNRNSYSEFWPVKSLEVIRVFPKDNVEILCDSSTYPDCNVFKIHDENMGNIETTSIFVALCRKQVEQGYVYNKCELGKIVAGFEVKQPE